MPIVNNGLKLGSVLLWGYMKLSRASSGIESSPGHGDKRQARDMRKEEMLSHALKCDAEARGRSSHTDVQQKAWHDQVSISGSSGSYSSSRNVARASRCFGRHSEDPIGVIELNMIHPHVSLP